MQDIFREMGATYSLLYPEQSGLRTPSSTSVLVARAVAYLQTHYQDPTLTTVQLAQELYASREHLSRAFKECTMESIHNYLIYLRMQHCRKALEVLQPSGILWYGKCPAEFDWNVTKIKPFQYERRHYRE